MREALPTVRQVIGSALRLLEQAWHLGFSFAAGIAAAWSDAQPWQQISFLVLIALVVYVAFIVSRSVLRGARYIFNVIACLTVLVMTIVPTVVVTFLALAGAIWIAKSFS